MISDWRFGSRHIKIFLFFTQNLNRRAAGLGCPWHPGAPSAPKRSVKSRGKARVAHRTLSSISKSLPLAPQPAASRKHSIVMPTNTVYGHRTALCPSPAVLTIVRNNPICGANHFTCPCSYGFERHPYGVRSALALGSSVATLRSQLAPINCEPPYLPGSRSGNFLLQFLSPRW